LPAEWLHFPARLWGYRTHRKRLDPGCSDTECGGSLEEATGWSRDSQRMTMVCWSWFWCS